MKRTLIIAVLVALGATLFSSCTTVPRDNNSATTNTNTSTSRTYSK